MFLLAVASCSHWRKKVNNQQYQCVDCHQLFSINEVQLVDGEDGTQVYQCLDCAEAIWEEQGRTYNQIMWEAVRRHRR